jgi:hypothetical protein
VFRGGRGAGEVGARGAVGAREDDWCAIGVRGANGVGAQLEGVLGDAWLGYRQGGEGVGGESRSNSFVRSSLHTYGFTKVLPWAIPPGATGLCTGSRHPRALMICHRPDQ